MILLGMSLHDWKYFAPSTWGLQVSRVFFFFTADMLKSALQNIFSMLPEILTLPDLNPCINYFKVYCFLKDKELTGSRLWKSYFLKKLQLGFKPSSKDKYLFVDGLQKACLHSCIIKQHHKWMFMLDDHIDPE